MKTVGAFEGKTHFSALIQAAERGETIVVTKKGRPVAQIGPVAAATLIKRSPADAVKSILARKICVGIPARKLIDEGRRQ
ncbi:MAG TPA: type II toxin-antitoxin system prevent-host-death family antitoxin [Candidatus Baltobacteraceae bacterium]|jgi:prevent-host-death family protein